MTNELYFPEARELRAASTAKRGKNRLMNRWSLQLQSRWKIGNANKLVGSRKKGKDSHTRIYTERIVSVSGDDFHLFIIVVSTTCNVHDIEMDIVEPLELQCNLQIKYEFYSSVD